MKIVIAGDGELGLHLAKILSSDDHDIIVVDPHKDLMQMLETQSDVMTLTGDSTCISVQMEAGVNQADLLISVVHDEKINILTTIIGKRLGAKYTVARFNNPEDITEEKKKIYKGLGIDSIICPENFAAFEIVKLLDTASAIETFEFSDGKLSLNFVKVEDEAPVIGKSMIEIAKSIPEMNFRVVAIARGAKTIIPRGDDVFCKGDKAYVISKPSGVDKIIELSGKTKVNIQNVMIIGGGRIGRFTAKRIEKKYNVKIIDIDRDRCNDLSDYLNSTLIINGDVRDMSLLEEEGIAGMDALVAATDNSETNILACLLAKQYGVKKTIASVENIDFFEISHNIGVDTIVNKKLVAAGYIARYTMEALVTSFYCLSGVDAEALEFVVKSNSPLIGKAICNIRFPKGTLVGGVIRKDKGHIATGSFIIHENDKVVVFSLPKFVNKVGKLFN